MIRGRYGLMNLLDEEVRVPQGGDAKFLDKVVDRQRSSKAFGAPGDMPHIRPNTFLIRHYAGDVLYDINGLVEKNADRLSRNLYDSSLWPLMTRGMPSSPHIPWWPRVRYDLLANASDGRTRAIFPTRDPKAAGKVSTVGEKFRGQLNKLMVTVERTQPFFIRCIKPNQQKAPSQLDMKMVIEQLTYAGVFEAVKIRKSGYPFRRPHAHFAKVYRWIARKAHGWVPIHASPTASAREYCQALLASVQQDFSNVRIGTPPVHFPWPLAPSLATCHLLLTVPP